VKLVLVTQTLDPAHPALAQTLDLVRALAGRVDELAVVTRDTRWDDPPANIRIRTFDAGSRAGRTLAFERAVAAGSAGADAVLVHMVPQFALLAAPVARVRRVPLLLWYTHWHASRALRLATRVVDAALSVDASSYPVSTTKLHAIGHAIDVDEFAATPVRAHDGPFRLLAVGRTARWKGLTTLLDAVALAVEDGADLALEIRGPSLTRDEEEHRRELEARVVGDARLAGRVEVVGAALRSEIPALIAAADAVVSPNEPHRGATLDKAVFEAAACARPVVSTNSGFAPLLGGLPLQLVVPPRDAAALAAAIGALARTAAGEREAVGGELRRRVAEHHSLAHWADSLIAVVREVRSHRGTAGSAGAG
jgi:glycosyltransferase involved in cell wall biosynthesis